jgi:hypothetical protein
MYSLEKIKTAVESKGYVWFNDDEVENFDVNIVGVRNSETENKVTNLFDDILTISYKEKGVWKYLEFDITTEAGKKGVLEFHNNLGVARLIPNQYRGAYSIALHKGQYEALCQRKPVAVWRDKNKDLFFDESPIIYRGLFGINIHRSNPKTQSTFVENWSEGCQVFKKVADFNKFMDICKKASKIHGNTFTYTLLTSKDLV